MNWMNVVRPRTFENTVAQLIVIGVGLAIYAVVEVIAIRREEKRIDALIKTDLVTEV